MTRERPPIQVPATPEYVLAKFLDEHRLLSPLDPEAEPDAVLGADSTIAEWRAIRDLVPTRPLGRALGRLWGIARTDAEWADVLGPARKRTLGGLCAFIADSGATRPAFEPAGFLGTRPCSAAGAFLAVRSILLESGTDADAITPATPLEPYLKKDLGDFISGPIAGLAPGALPVVREIPHPSIALAVKALFYTVVVPILALFVVLIGMQWGAAPGVDPTWIWLSYLCAFGVLIIGTTVIGAIDGAYELTRYELGDLRTFKDLARALAAGA